MQTLCIRELTIAKDKEDMKMSKYQLVFLHLVSYIFIEKKEAKRRNE